MKLHSTKDGSVFISIKKVSSVFSPQFTWKGHKFQWKKKSPNNFLPTWAFFGFRSPKNSPNFQDLAEKEGREEKAAGSGKGLDEFFIGWPLKYWGVANFLAENSISGP